MSHDIQALDHIYTAGDRLPELVGVLTGLDLAGFTVTLHVKRPDKTTFSRTAIITDAAKGIFKFTFTTTDFVAGFCQLAEVQFADVLGLTMTSPKFFINVEEQIL